ncbi:glycosyltransferase [Mucilaginibacter sp. PAMB04274]|uniref:glycosyltransferase n=1 Tax=Mucilaginibacter sp. PAMB04274 TaxID=3138568 RepID=UPI0031F6DC37
MRVAVVHDELMRRGGAEQVVLTILKAFPEADVYTLAYDENSTYPEFKQYNVNTSLFQILAKNVKVMHALFFPLGIIAMQQMHIKNYDVVIISNTHCAKYVKIDPKSLVFMYTHTPFRLAWNPTSYTQYLKSTGLYRTLFDVVIKQLKRIDAKSAKRADYFLTNTAEVAERIKKAYKVKTVHVIKPDVKVRNFYLSEHISNYYLIVTRLEYYKKVDLAIQAFNMLGIKLIVVGNGTKSAELKQIAKNNIEFKSDLSNNELAELYSKCRGFIFPQHEDYGITPLEANASGRPVIAYGAGGVLETMIPYSGDADHCTAVFFDAQTPEALCDAVRRAESISFNTLFIREHAEKFDETVFIQQLKSFVIDKYDKKALNTIST